MRHAVYDAAVPHHGEPEAQARQAAAVLGFPIGFGYRAFADLQSGHHAVPIEPLTLTKTRAARQGYSLRAQACRPVNGFRRPAAVATIAARGRSRPFDSENMAEPATTLARKIAKTIADEIGAAASQVQAAVALLDEGATVPFIARYRKEVTGGLDDTQLRTLETRLSYLRELEDRRKTILASIDEQGKLT